MQFCGNYEEKQKGSALKNAPAFQGSGWQHVPKEERPPLKRFHSQTSLHVMGKMHGRGRPSPDLTASDFLKIAPPPKVLSRQLSFHSARFPFFSKMSMSVLPLHGYLLPRSSLEHGGSSLLRTEQCHKVFEEPLRIFFYSKTH